MTMRFLYGVMVVLILIGGTGWTTAADETESAAKKVESKESVVSRVETADNGDVVLIHEIQIEAPVEKVWAAYSTEAGWRAWVAPVAKVDLKVGGTIKTNYRADGSADDDDAITLHVVNYVPRRLITLQAEMGTHWPEILKEREKNLYNVITFESIEEGRATRVVSYGTGYRNTPELLKLLAFFQQANSKLYQGLVDYVEQGKKSF